MKLIVDQDGVKRALADKPFRLCADVETFRAVHEACQRFLEGGAVYGWVRVEEEIGSGGDPLPWKEGA